MYFIILFLFCQDFRRVKTQNSNYDFWKLPKKYKYVWIKLQAESKIQYSQYDYTVFSVIPLGLRDAPLRTTRFWYKLFILAGLLLLLNCISDFPIIIFQ